MYTQNDCNQTEIFFSKLLMVPFFQDEDENFELCEKEHAQIHAFATQRFLAHLENLPVFKVIRDRTEFCMDSKETSARLESTATSEKGSQTAPAAKPLVDMSDKSIAFLDKYWHPFRKASE